jgi:YD repeat-containing protein
VIDPRQASTRFVYDSLGRLRTMTDALTHSASYRYDGGGLKIRETDRRGVERQFSYDNLGRPRVTTLVPSISGVASRREVIYDDRGRKRTEIDARSHLALADLDGLDRVVRVTDARNGTVVTRWDGVNRREETDKRGHTTTFDYDELNRPIRVTDPAPFSAQTVETTYLDAQNRVSVKDRRGAVTVSQMDPLGRTLTVTRAGITQETNAYDQVGNKTSAKDGESKETRFTYDAVNRLSERTDGFGTPDAALTTYKYDANGNRTEERDARLASLGEPWSTKNTYDPLNRLETMTDGETDVTRYAYDEEATAPRSSSRSSRRRRTPTTSWASCSAWSSPAIG